MKCLTQRETLLTGLALATKIVDKRTHIPILANVRLVANGALQIDSTDMDAVISTRLPVEIEGKGEITVSCHGLASAVKSLEKGAAVELETEDNVLRVRSGRLSLSFPTLPVEDWPELKQHKVEAKFQIPAAELERMLSTVNHAISTEETHYYLNGVFFNITHDKKFGVVATDGHRLGLSTMEIPKGAAKMTRGVIVPRLAVRTLLGLLKKAKGNVGIVVRETTILFAVGDTTLHTKQIDGNFPDYTRVIPADNDIHMTAKRDDLAGVIDRLSKFSDGGFRLTLTPGNAAFWVRTPGDGEATESIDVEFKSAGAEFEIGFNGKYLAAILKSIDSDTVVVDFSDAAGPFITRDPHDDTALHVQMPMRV